MYKIIITYIILICFSPLSLMSQTKEKVNLNEGLGFYKSGSYQSARKKFDQAYADNPRYTKALYNAGNAAYLNGSFDTAIIYYDDYTKQIKSDNEIAKAHFNIGNAHLQKAQIAEADKEKLKEAQAFYKEAIQSYKTSLKHRPDDPETKYNLTYALNKLQKNQQQEQQQNKDQNKDDQEKNENQDNQENSEKKDGDNGDQGDPNDDNKDPKDPKDGGKDGDDSDENKKEPKNKEGDKQEDKEGEKEKSQDGKPGDPNNEEPVEGQISRAQAIKDLDAINNEEGKVLQKVYQKKGDKKEKKNSDKDW